MNFKLCAFYSFFLFINRMSPTKYCAFCKEPHKSSMCTLQSLMSRHITIWHTGFDPESRKIYFPSSTAASTEQCTMWIYQDITLASNSSSGGYHLWVDHRGQVAWYTPGVWEALVFGQLDHWSIPSQYIRSWYWFVRKWRVTLWDTRSFIEV